MPILVFLMKLWTSEDYTRNQESSSPSLEGKRMQVEITELKKGASLGNTIINMHLKHKSDLTKTAMGKGNWRRQERWLEKREQINSLTLWGQGTQRQVPTQYKTSDKKHQLLNNRIYLKFEKTFKNVSSAAGNKDCSREGESSGKQETGKVNSW